jgi:hypothetical protein
VVYILNSVGLLLLPPLLLLLLPPPLEGVVCIRVLH